MIARLTPLLGLAAAACATTPTPPQTVQPARSAEPFAAVAGTTSAPLPDQWWRLYDDPELDRLVAASLAANVDLRIAFANLDGARAARRGARAQRLPQTGIESGLTVDGTASQPSASGVPSTDYDVAATVSWDIDLFGRLRAGALAARADAEALEAARDGVRVAVVADTVLAYVDLCGAVAGAATANAIVAAQAIALETVRDQLRAGEVSPLEVSQAANLLATARSAIPTFEAARGNALYRLAMLQGVTPAAARDWPLRCAAIPRLTPGLPVGDGAALLARRPDIREAERKLAAAAARVGVARADLYPRINLGGALGLLTGAFSASLSPLVTWNFPNQGPARARLAQAGATERGALAGWYKAVLTALKDVETSLAELDGEARRNLLLGVAVTEAAAYERRAGARVRLGDASWLLLRDATRATATARLDKIRTDLLVARGQVAVFRALGGGWQTPAGPR